MRARPTALLVILLLAAGAAAQTREPDASRPPRWMNERPARAPAGAKLIRDLEYGRAPGNVTLKLDLYLPDPPGSTPRPLVVWIHGGGWRNGSKAGCRATRLVARGYAVASVEYRLSHEATFPAQIHDCKAAIRWLRAGAARFGIDPDRIGVWGSSAGGHLSALLGTSGDVDDLDGSGNDLRASSRVQAVCDFCGPTDLGALFRQPLGRTARSPVSLLLGGTPEEKPDLAARANPITHVTRDDPPFLIVHGREDRTVPPDQSTLLHEALVNAGVSSTLRIVNGVGHGIRGEAVDRAVDAFFDRHLGPVPPVTGRTQDVDWSRRTFESARLGRKVRYHVYRPPGHDESERRFPTIYWLHGMGGNSGRGIVFAKHIDRMIRTGSMPPVLVIGVDGGKASFYCDAAQGGAVESMIIEELIPHVDATYRTVAGRDGRAVEGFSMGGFGALHLALKHPDRFAAATSVAGALLEATTLPARHGPALRTVFGTDAKLAAECPAGLARAHADRIRGRVRIRLAVGELDGLRSHMWSMYEALQALSIAHEVTVLADVGHDAAGAYERLGDRTAAFYRSVFGE